MRYECRGRGRYLWGGFESRSGSKKRGPKPDMLRGKKSRRWERVGLFEDQEEIGKEMKGGKRKAGNSNNQLLVKLLVSCCR